MAELKIDTETPHPCNCGETHKGHICWLSKMHMLMEVQHHAAVTGARSIASKRHLPTFYWKRFCPFF